MRVLGAAALGDLLGELAVRAGEPVRHLVERVSERADLVGVVDLDAVVEVAAGDAVHTEPQPVERAASRVESSASEVRVMNPTASTDSQTPHVDVVCCASRLRAETSVCRRDEREASDSEVEESCRASASAYA